MKLLLVIAHSQRKIR